MSAKLRMNILRQIRLQLKSGFMKEEPAEYRFMKRYPPLRRDSKVNKVTKIDTKTIPYYELYEKVIQKNPLYTDEKVYPAYWQQEPQALTLAKKQYQYMQEGLDEETAYNKAVSYIDELEDQSYNELKSILDTFKENNVTLPYLNEKSLAEELAQWKQKLLETPYEELDLADQGEIDHLIQTKILKWGEVERERRMKDPIFVMQFEKLRYSIFPLNDYNINQEKLRFREEIKTNLLTLNDIDVTKLCTTAPFYVEDYLSYYNKVKAQPDLRKWDRQEKDALTRWVVDTLAYKAIIDNKPQYKIYKYIEELKSQFFPMIHHIDDNNKLNDFKPLTVDEIKAILYNNDIGYKKQNNKLFVKRFYRLPVLLFPKEIFTAVLMSDEDRLRSILYDEQDGLLKELTSAGIDEASLPEIQSQLEEYLKDSEGLPNYTKFDPNDPNSRDIDVSSLDDLLSDKFDDADNESDDIEGADEDSDNENDDVIALDTNANADSDEWQQLLSKYKKPAVTGLEQERDRMYSQVEHNILDFAQNEDDLEAFKTMRMENELISRARMAKSYEDKEGARRLREWKKRGVWLDKMPHSASPIVEN